MVTWIDRVVRYSLILVPVGFALLALAFGQDANWDLRNYHWYNPYAFLAGRLSIDLGVAHVATFYNPLLDLPTYLVGKVLPARLMGALLGFIHGLNFVLLYGLADVSLGGLVPDIRASYRRLAAAALALVGVLGGGHLALVGTTFNDNVVSLAVLSSALLVMRRAAVLFSSSLSLPDGRELWTVAGAGAFVGFAAGLKLPTAIFAVGLCAAFLFSAGHFKRRFTLAFVFGLGVTTAFMIAAGPWMWTLWRDYANPLFPYFNTFFHSPMGVADSYRDARFIPRGAVAFLTFPVLFSLDPRQVGEVSFSDYRVLAAYVALIMTAVIAVIERLRGTRATVLPPTCCYLIAACAVTYLVWMPVFAIYRYIVVLEMLSPLLVAIAVMRWPVSHAIRIGIIAVVLTVLTVSARRADWTHSPWQSGPFVTASVPAVSAPDRTLAVIAGLNPVGWLVPYFPPQIPFIRLQGYLNAPDQPSNGLNERASVMIAGHKGDIFLLTPVMEADTAEKALRAYALRPDWPSCQPILSNLGDYARWCRVYRTSEPAPSPTPPFSRSE